MEWKILVGKDKNGTWEDRGWWKGDGFMRAVNSYKRSQKRADWEIEMINDPRTVDTPFYRIIGEDGSVYGHHVRRSGGRRSSVDFKTMFRVVIRESRTALEIIERLVLLSDTIPDIWNQLKHLLEIVMYSSIISRSKKWGLCTRYPANY